MPTISEATFPICAIWPSKAGAGRFLAVRFWPGPALFMAPPVVLQWLEETGTAALHIPIPQIWTGATILFALIWVLLFFRLRGSGAPAAGLAQFGFGMAWSGCGIGSW